MTIYHHPPDVTTDVCSAAQAYRKSGLSVIPVDPKDKAPAMHLLPKNAKGRPTWEPYRRHIADEAMVRRWCQAGLFAIAVVCGKVSGGLQVLDFDEARLFQAWLQAVGKLADELVIVQTGRGYHVLFRSDNPGQSAKLAWVLDEQQPSGRRIGIEFLGEGRYVVTAPSLHPNGQRYRIIRGSLTNTPRIAPAHREALLQAARNLNEVPCSRQDLQRMAAKATSQFHRRRTRRAGADIIGTFNKTFPVTAILERNRYKRGPSGRYIAPDGDRESISIINGLSFHWDSDDPLNDGKVRSDYGVHDAFDAYRLLEHHGDLDAALEAAAGELGFPVPAAPGGVPLDRLYVQTPQGIFGRRLAREGETVIQLTNFTARIVADIVWDDGVRQQIAYRIEAALDGIQKTFLVPAAQYPAMNWITEHFGTAAVVFPGSTIRDHARAAIQLLSPRPPRQMIYTHTGWRQIDQAWVYLHADGVLGAAGPVQGIQVELPGTLEAFALPNPPEGEEARAAIRGSLELLDVAADCVVFPIFCQIWRAVLGGCDYSLHLMGPTGVFKSELAALAQQHFGKHLDARHLPASWHSTDNYLEALLFYAKDALIVMDDFAPSGGPHDVARWHQRADRIFRAQGNRAARGRLDRDSNLQRLKPSRSSILSTGEESPQGQSIRSRVLMLEISQGDIAREALTHCQKQARSGLYAAAMAGFIRYLAPHYEQVQRDLPSELESLREEVAAVPDYGEAHRRTLEIVANLALGLRWFLAYAQAAGALSEAEAQALWRRGWTALLQAGAKQAEHQAAEEPAQRAMELLRSALVSGHAHLADRHGHAPANPERWGWRKLTDASLEYQPQGRRIGWVDGDNVYLDPGAFHSVVQALARMSGESLPGPQTLRKRMAEKGLLIREGKKDTLTVRKSLEGALRKVLQLSVSTLYPEPDKTDISDKSPAGKGRTGVASQLSLSGFSDSAKKT